MSFDLGKPSDDPLLQKIEFFSDLRCGLLRKEMQPEQCDEEGSQVEQVQTEWPDGIQKELGDALASD